MKVAIKLHLESGLPGEYSRYNPSRRFIEHWVDESILPHGWEKFYDGGKRELARFEPCPGLLPTKIIPRPIVAPPPGQGVPDEECLSAIQDFMDGGGWDCGGWGF